ncbi:MAG TPA: NAD(P)-binding domain-containing protein [Kofleriaceae bacterium]|nr:NAD(P)-binding domain-containing protein [Kofleriaceae bacterium]
MSGTALLAVLIGGSVAAYLAWAWVDRRRHHRAVAVAADVATLGEDVVPASIHPEIDPEVCMGSGACVRACPEGEVLGLVSGRAQLINPLACIGHGACAAACPVGAITLVFGSARRGVELPAVDPDFQTAQPGVYVVGELGGMGLIRNAIEQGRQAAAAIARSPRRGVHGAIDALVVGAGPAGLAATLGLLEAGLRVRLIDQDSYGGTILHYPRSKVTMTGTLDLPIFGRVGRRTMSKEELLALWQDIRERVNLPIELGVRLESLAADAAGGWIAGTSAGPMRAASMVLALGRRGVPRHLEVPGEHRGKVHYRLLEPEPFAGKHTLVIGGGNAAAECALALADFGGCASVALSYRRAALARLRAAVRARVDQAVDDGRLRLLLSTVVTAIEDRSVQLEGPDGPITLANDDLFVQIGGTPPRELLAACGIDMIEKRGER